MAILTAGACLLTTSCQQVGPDAAGFDPAAAAFRDAISAPPPGYSGPVFELSHDYPAQKPGCEAPWLKRNVSFTDPNADWNQWRDYIGDIVDYVWKGQDPNLPDQIGWQSKVGSETRWFHVPWMAYDGERGREFAHGLTNELSTAESTFRNGGRGSGKHTLVGATKQDGVDPLFETWSVGMYNPCGAWSIGQAIAKNGVPQMTKDASDRDLVNGMPFAPGTVVIKILNTTADASSVPFLKGSTSWTADAHVQESAVKYSQCERKVRKVHLVQMDIAVVDPRSPTRWVYSTLVYDGNLPGKTVRSRMVPLGVQFGSDPQTYPAVAREDSKPLWQSIHAPVGVPEHYGCEGRLAGAVDQANSSCVSCHMAAYAAPVGTVGKPGQNIPNPFGLPSPGLCLAADAGNKTYFSNYKYPDKYPDGKYDSALPLDSSLQLQVAFNEYATALNPPAKPACPPAGK